MILKAKQKAKLLVEILRCHTSHKSSNCVFLFFLRRALIQQSVNAGEKLAFIKMVTKVCWSQQQPDWPDGHHWWPFTCQRCSGGYCVALKWQGCEATDEKVNTQRSGPFALKERGICRNLSAVFVWDNAALLKLKALKCFHVKVVSHDDFFCVCDSELATVTRSDFHPLCIIGFTAVFIERSKGKLQLQMPSF